MFALFGAKREYDVESSKENKLARIAIENVKPNPNQPRRTFDNRALQELSDSIVEHGLMQPIVVRPQGEGFELIAGERRWRACKLAGLREVDAYVIETDSEQSACMALVENLHREDLHFFEVAESYSALMSLYGMTQEQLAKRVGKKQSTVANKLRVARMAQAVKEAIVDYGLTERHARALLKLTEDKAQLDMIEIIVKKGLSVKDTELLIESYFTKQQEEKKPHITRLLRDHRLFVNTIKAAVKDLHEAGVNASYTVDEADEFIYVTVAIPKHP